MYICSRLGTSVLKNLTSPENLRLLATSTSQPWRQHPRHDPISGVHCVALCDKVRSCEIRKALNVEPLSRIQRSQLPCFGHLSKMPREKLGRQVLLVTTTEKRLIRLPRTRWSDYISELVCPISSWC